jgi:hypothetical protein
MEARNSVVPPEGGQSVGGIQTSNSVDIEQTRQQRRAEERKARKERPAAIPDVNEIRGALALLVEPGGVVEIRGLNVLMPGDRQPHVSRGFYERAHFDLAAEQAAELSRFASGVYATLNRIDPSLLARSPNQIQHLVPTGTSTADTDIIRRRWLLIDCDAVRPANASATDGEREQATLTARAIYAALREAGWPDPIGADSGNGAHLLYAIDLPNDDAAKALLRGVLRGLAFRFDTETVKVDQTTYNASRITKLYGTVAAKGKDLPDRPHRLSRVIRVPHELAGVSREHLQEVAAWLPPAPPPKVKGEWCGRAGTKLDLDAWIARYAPDASGPRPWQSGRKWIFRVCPWLAEHNNAAAFIVEFPDGAIAAGCHHNGCSGHGWRDLRALREPGCYDRREHVCERPRRDPWVRRENRRVIRGDQLPPLVRPVGIALPPLVRPDGAELPPLVRPGGER